MTIDRRTFFAYARRAPFGGRLSSTQVDGLNRLLDEWERRNLADGRWLAYALATAFRETGAAMQPVSEKGGPSYWWRMYDIKGERPQAARALGNLAPGDGVKYHGRGDVQLTGRSNYARAAKETSVDLIANPDLALRPDLSARILFAGMIEGWFTGKRLAQYFDATHADPVGARAIVNGKDKAKLIAGYYGAFRDALAAADTATPLPADVPADADKPDQAPAAQSKGLWGALLSLLTGSISLPILGQIDNLYALAAFIVLVLAGGYIVRLMVTGKLKIDFLRGAP